MLHWEGSHFGADDFSDYAAQYTTSSADREWFTKDYDPFDGAFGCDFGSDMNGMDYVGVDFGVDFGVDALTIGALGFGILAGVAATGHHLLSIHHLMNKHQRHPTPAHAGASALSEHDAEVTGMSGPSAADPFQLGG